MASSGPGLDNSSIRPSFAPHGEKGSLRPAQHSAALSAGSTHVVGTSTPLQAGMNSKAATHSPLTLGKKISSGPKDSKDVSDRMKNLLNPDRPFACPEPGCAKRFNRRFTLSEHMKTHTGARPYACPEAGCGKRFSTSGNLARHKRMHTGAKPFCCPIDGCGKKFASNGKLSRHMQTHTGARPFQCSLPDCGKKFSTQGNLTRHMKIHGIFSPLAKPAQPNYIPPRKEMQKEKFQAKPFVSAPRMERTHQMMQQKFMFSQMSGIPMLEASPRFSLLSPRRPHLFEGPPYEMVELDPLPFTSLYASASAHAHDEKMGADNAGGNHCHMPESSLAGFSEAHYFMRKTGMTPRGYPSKNMLNMLDIANDDLMFNFPDKLVSPSSPNMNFTLDTFCPLPDDRIPDLPTPSKTQKKPKLGHHMKTGYSRASVSSMLADKESSISNMSMAQPTMGA